MAETNCRHFNGYKPCPKSPTCERTQCGHFTSVQARILIIHLGALGAVLRSTALLQAIHRKYAKAHITWVTSAPAQRLLENNTLIDRVLTTAPEDVLQLKALRFDAALVIDKSLTAAGLLYSTHADQVFGFRSQPETGAIVPANSEAMELWNLGLSNEQKFFKNQKTEQHLVHEALQLGAYRRDEYLVNLNHEESSLADLRRSQWLRDRQWIIGINTGASGTLAAKKLTVDGHRRLISEILSDSRFKDAAIVLLGGAEDTDRNRQIARDLPVIESPSQRGLRDGLASVAACDVVFSGDSLGMHMAIALRKWVVAWFGPTCAQEIDLYDRGQKVLTKASCSPCWKRVCDQTTMCYDQVDFLSVRDGLAQGFTWLTSSSKPHSLETFSSPSP